MVLAKLVLCMGLVLGLSFSTAGLENSNVFSISLRGDSTGAALQAVNLGCKKSGSRCFLADCYRECCSGKKEWSFRHFGFYCKGPDPTVPDRPEVSNDQTGCLQPGQKCFIYQCAERCCDHLYQWEWKKFAWYCQESYKVPVPNPTAKPTMEPTKWSKTKSPTSEPTRSQCLTSGTKCSVSNCTEICCSKKINIQLGTGITCL